MKIPFSPLSRRFFAAFLGSFCALSCAASRSLAAPLVQSDFSLSNQPFQVQNATGQSISGVLPLGWQDRSGYQSDAKISYQLVEVDGRKGLRATKIAGAEVQLYHPLPTDLVAGATYRLSVTGRNPDQMGIKFGVRDIGPPYTMYWSKDAAWGDEWQTWSADFTLPAKRNPAGFFVFASGKGAFDLGQLTLTQRTGEDILAEIRARYPDGGPKNLMRQTRFPLGLPSGWSVETREASLGQDVQIEADPAQIGPSGAPALRVQTQLLAQPQTQGRLTLWGAPFEFARPLETHTASFWARGSGSGKVQMRADYNQTVASQEFQIAPAQGWKRVSMTFVAPASAKVSALRFELQGDIALDAFQVEPGALATPYASQFPLEIALAPRAGDASLVRIHFDDETPAIRYLISGKTASNAQNRVRARVVDANGKSRDLALSQGERGEFRYDNPGQTLGAFRLEARVEDARAQPLSAWSELVMTRVHRPRYWGRDAPNSPFGIHLNPTRQELLIAKASGANWTRLHDAGSELMKWALLEPEKGQWKWRDEGIQRLRAAHFKILGVLQTTPKWASLGQEGGLGYYDQYFLPANIADWKNYVRQVTTRYRGQIDAYDVWNEPWGGGYLNIARDKAGNGKAAFVRPQDQIGAYLQLQRAAVDVAREVDPQLKILVDTTRGDWTTRTLAEEKEKAATFGDVLAFHSYPGAIAGWPTDSVAGGVRSKRQAIGASLNSNRALWMTEGSPVNDRLFSGIYNHTLPYQSEENVVDTSNRLARYMLSLLSSGTGRIFLYSQGKTAHFGKEITRWAVNVMEDGYPHPSLAAHSELAFLLEDTRHLKNLEVAPGVFAFVFEGNRGAVAAISTAPGHAPYTLPQAPGVTALDLFGNPLQTREIKENVVYLVTNDPAARLETLLGGKLAP